MKLCFCLFADTHSVHVYLVCMYDLNICFPYRLNNVMHIDWSADCVCCANCNLLVMGCVNWSPVKQN